jgi:hypothetical protein
MPKEKKTYSLIGRSRWYLRKITGTEEQPERTIPMSLSHIKSFILTCKEGYFSFIQRIIVIWKMELPWLESSTTTSTPAYSQTTTLLKTSQKKATMPFY